VVSKRRRSEIETKTTGFKRRPTARPPVLETSNDMMEKVVDAGEKVNNGTGK
jgi:hypothetical protein